MATFEWVARYREAHQRIWHPTIKAAPPPPPPAEAPAPQPRHFEFPIRIIQRTVAEHFGLSPNVLTAPARHRACLLPRFIAMRLARELLRLSLPKIGRYFGKRDHSTVMHALRKIDSEIQHDHELADTVALLREQASIRIEQQRQGVKHHEQHRPDGQGDLRREAPGGERRAARTDHGGVAAG